jgi:hypothetical protein
LGDHALLNLIGARWVQAFENIRASTINMHDTEHSMFIHKHMLVAIINTAWMTGAGLSRNLPHIQGFLHL